MKSKPVKGWQISIFQILIRCLDLAGGFKQIGTDFVNIFLAKSW